MAHLPKMQQSRPRSNSASSAPPQPPSPSPRRERSNTLSLQQSPTLNRARSDSRALDDLKLGPYEPWMKGVQKLTKPRARSALHGADDGGGGGGAGGRGASRPKWEALLFPAAAAAPVGGGDGPAKPGSDVIRTGGGVSVLPPKELVWNSPGVGLDSVFKLAIPAVAPGSTLRSVGTFGRSVGIRLRNRMSTLTFT